MSLATHLSELSEKHRSLERRIEQEMAHPSSTDAEINRLKFEKLKLKEQIVHLERKAAVAVKH